MKIERYFKPADRYFFDFGMCAPAKGFAQVDTEQDAAYYGTWANPFTLSIVSYCEGDVCISTADNTDEFVDEIRKIKDWNEKGGWRFGGIDPGFNDKLRYRFIELGLSDLLH